MLRLATLAAALLAWNRSAASPAVSAGEAATTGVAARTTLADSLEALERQSWEAWQKRDAGFFGSFLSDDHVEVGFGGPTDKKAVLAGVASPSCVVTSYKVDSFVLKVLEPNVAVLTYHAAQTTTCGGNPVPSPVWVTSIYINRAGRWMNAVYQQTQTAK